jgi:hypothetical protein
MPRTSAQPSVGEGLSGLDVCSLLALGASGDVKRYALAFLAVPLAIMMLLIRGDISPHIPDGSRCELWEYKRLRLSPPTQAY